MLSTFSVSIGTATGSNPISISIAVTNHGPLSACSAAPCAPNTLTVFYIFLTNTNPPSQSVGRRDLIPNAYVVSSVDVLWTVNGSIPGTFTIVPPPSSGGTIPFFGFGRWPVEVVPGTCSGDSCSIGSPAVLPGENIAIFYMGWVHGSDEPNGRYVFTFTVHGTVNGSPLDVVGRSSTIVMTS